MFPQKFTFWSDYNVTHAPSYEPYPYSNDPNYTYVANNPHSNTTNMSPNISMYGSHGKVYENSPDYLKDILDKLADKEKYIIGVEKEIVGQLSPRQYPHGPNHGKDYNPCAYNVMSENTEQVEAETGCEKQSNLKKCNILSRFYKPDGTPLKSLWDSDSSLKEQRSYKYDPKPLERRKNPRAFVPDERKTKEYWDRRQKNNVAARKSREDRRKKEIEILKHVELLKNDNLKLKVYAQKVMSENQNLTYELDLLKRL